MPTEPQLEIRFHPAWTSARVSTAFDLQRWEHWSGEPHVPFVCWQLGSLTRNLIVFECLTLIDIASFRVVSFGWNLELSTSSTELEQVLYCRLHGIAWQDFLDSQVPDPPLAHVSEAE